MKADRTAFGVERSTEAPLNGLGRKLPGIASGKVTVPVADHQAMAEAILDTLDAPPPEPGFLKARALDFHVDKIVAQYIDVLGLTESVGLHDRKGCK